MHFNNTKKYYCNDKVSEIKSKLLQLLLYSNGYLTNHLEFVFQEPLILNIIQTSLKNNSSSTKKNTKLNILNNYLIQREIGLHTKSQKQLIYAISWWPYKNFEDYHSNQNISLGYNLSKNSKKFKKKIQYINKNYFFNQDKSFQKKKKGFLRYSILWNKSQAIGILQELFLPYLLQNWIL